jgi:hypothetical protein
MGLIAAIAPAKQCPVQLLINGIDNQWYRQLDIMGYIAAIAPAQQCPVQLLICGCHVPSRHQFATKCVVRVTKNTNNLFSMQHTQPCTASNILMHSKQHTDAQQATY